MKRAFLALAVALNLILVDAVAKELAVGFLKGSAPVSVIPGLFDLAYVENRGCAWGLLQGQVWPLAVFGVLALALIVWKRRSLFYESVSTKRMTVVAFAAECLLEAGIVGNLIDRVFRGYVIDFLDFHWQASHFPCFNLADTYISVSVGILLLMSLANVKARRF